MSTISSCGPITFWFQCSSIIEKKIRMIKKRGKNCSFNEKLTRDDWCLMDTFEKLDQSCSGYHQDWDIMLVSGAIINIRAQCDTKYISSPIDSKTDCVTVYGRICMESVTFLLNTNILKKLKPPMWPVTNILNPINLWTDTNYALYLTLECEY